MSTSTETKLIKPDCRHSNKGIRITTWKCSPSIPSAIKKLQVSVLPTMSEPLRKRKKPFVSILSSDAPYVNQDGHTRTNTKNGWHVGSSILSYTVHGCCWEKHNIRKEISRKLPQPFLISCASMTDKRASLPKL